MANEKLHESYRAFLLRQPCRCQPCVSPVVVHHNTFGETEQHAKSLGGKRGKGQRASDLEGMPLCSKHHRELHDMRGFFGDFDKLTLREWQAQQVRELQNQFAVQEPQPKAATERAKRCSPGAGWTVGGVLDLLKKEARHRPADVAAAFTEVVGLIERDML